LTFVRIVSSIHIKMVKIFGQNLSEENVSTQVHTNEVICSSELSSNSQPSYERELEEGNLLLVVRILFTVFSLLYLSHWELDVVGGGRQFVQCHQDFVRVLA